MDDWGKDFYYIICILVMLCKKDKDLSTLFMVSETEEFQPTPAKVELKSNWDDEDVEEDVDENDIKDSWEEEEEDDDEPTPVFSFFFSFSIICIILQNYI